MTLRTFRWQLAALFFMASAPFAAAQDFFFKKGDVVVMMGDSITEQRLYSNYVETWSQTRFPQHNLVFRNVGIGGDRSTGGNSRFKRDVLPHKATVLTVDFGMNDGSYTAFSDKTFTPYMKGLQGIADQAKAANIRVAWITPQPVEHKPGDKAESYNETLEKFGDGVKQIAEKNNGVFVDQFHPYWSVIEKARKNGEKGRITAGDAVHPGPPGQAMMAAAILKGLKFPREVSEVAIEGTKVEAKKCKVSGFTSTEKGIKFDRTDEALPFFPESAKGILKFTPLLDEMNYYGLKVVALPKGNYDVLLGGKKVGTYSEADLAKGVNLAEAALTAGPVADQVKDVVKAITDKTNYYHGQIYRGLILANVAKLPDFKDVGKDDIAKKRDALVEQRMQKMPEYDAAIRKALEPRQHSVEVVLSK